MKKNFFNPIFKLLLFAGICLVIFLLTSVSQVKNIERISDKNETDLSYFSETIVLDDLSIEICDEESKSFKKNLIVCKKDNTRFQYLGFIKQFSFSPDFYFDRHLIPLFHSDLPPPAFLIA